MAAIVGSVITSPHETADLLRRRLVNAILRASASSVHVPTGR